MVTRVPRKAISGAESVAADRALGVLGIGPDEERVYRLLLGRGPTTADEVSRAVGESPRRTQQLLDAIEAKGLATHSPEQPRATSPPRPTSRSRP